MTFDLHVEHKLVGGESVLETFEEVESFNNPPMTDNLHISFADEDREDEKLSYGTVVRGISD